MKNSSIPIILASDDNYAPFALTAILSVVSNTESNVSFYVLDGGISDENKQIIMQQCAEKENCEVSFIAVDPEELFRGFYTIGFISLSTYSRFLAPKLLPEIRKAIYLDDDIIVCGDIAELYENDLGQFSLGAVPEQVSSKCLIEPKQKVGMVENSVYFNAGVLLIDMEKWREEGVVDILLELEKKYHDNSPNDQDILNKYFENNYLELDRKFNWESTDDGIYIIRHYIGTPKPWKMLPKQCAGDFQDYQLFWKYLSRTPFHDALLSECTEMTPAQLHLQHFFRSKYMFGK